jgi:methionine-rich copper-binding protein CopC
MVDDRMILPNVINAPILLKIKKHTNFISVIVPFANLCLIAISLLLLPVYGHPNPIAYKPQPNQIINTSQPLPDDVTITFTERPELKASSIKVVDFNNERVDKNDLKFAGSDKTLSVSLDVSKMKLGFYTINWLILSKDDGFISKGSYVFSLDKDNG